MIEDFYPTPKPLIQRMLEGLKLDEMESILEPSAGKGDICDYICEEAYRRRNHSIDVIEINPDLQHILRGKNYHLIQDDFLTFDTHKVYDLIVANFPFSTGDQHLQKAISLLEKNGGKLICLVNAETIRNPYTKLRETLTLKLEKHGAEIEFLEDEFEQAERPTNVEVALVKLSIERPDIPSVILDSLRKAEEVRVEEESQRQLVENDFMQGLVAQFNVECRCGIRLIEEYFSLKPYVLDRFARKDELTNDKFDYRDALIKLEVKGAYSTKASYVNSYLSGVRHKYWELLIHDPRFNSFYTSNILSDLSNKLTDLRDYDFNLFNIQELIKEMNSKIIAGIEQSILSLFDKFSRKFAWDESLHEGNVHYYNGWKTNKAHKINSKIIIPVNGISAWDKKLEYGIYEELSDMVKVFNYLSDDKANVKLLVGNACDKANRWQKFSGMDLRYFETTFYKKGTCHIKFKDQRLLDKLNIFGSQRKGWLPPAYGKKPYSEMGEEERAVVDDFQGKEAYAEVILHSDYYLVETATMLQLVGGFSEAQI